MVHLVYCDNAGKKGEKVLDKILAGTKTMVIRVLLVEKYHIVEYLKMSYFILWKKELEKYLQKPLLKR